MLIRLWNRALERKAINVVDASFELNPKYRTNRTSLVFNGILSRCHSPGLWDTWKNHSEGLGHLAYLSGIAINSDDPQNIVVSAASNAEKAHFRQDPESFVYRYSSDDKKWIWLLTICQTQKETSFRCLNPILTLGMSFTA